MVFLFFLSLLLFALTWTVIKSKEFGVAPIALVSGLIKVILCVIGTFIVLPFGGTDGIRFEQVAADWSLLSFSEIVRDINVSGSYLISSITAIFYRAIDRDIIIPISINGILGIFSFYLSLVLYKEVWGEKRVNKTFAILVALHPMLNVNSAIVLRESYIIFFILMAK